MVSLLELFKEFEESRGFHSLVNLSEFVGERAFLTKNGFLGLVLATRGPDGECLDPASTEAVRTLIQSANRVFDERFILNTFLSKRAHPILACSSSSNKIFREAEKNRHEFLRAKGAALYTFEQYLTVMIRPEWENPNRAARWIAFGQNPLQALRRAFRTSDLVRAFDSTIAASLRKLEQAAESFIEQTREQFATRILGNSEAFQFFRRMFNPDPVKASAVRLVESAPLDFQVCDSVLECYRDHLRLDDYFIKILTLKQLPSHSYANMFSALCQIKAELLISTEWSAQEPSLALADIRSRRRHWHNLKTSLLSQVGSERPYERDLLYDNSKEGIAEQLGELLKAIEMRGARTGPFSLGALIYARSLEEAERASAEVMKVVGVHDGAMNEERHNGLNAFLAALPGGHPYNLRPSLITDENYADMVPWFRPAEGDRYNAFLRAAYLVALETEDNSLYHFNLHVQDVGHMAVLGPTGGGKSFLMNFLLTHAQQYDPFTFIFDRGGSYRWLTKMLNGSCVKFRPDGNAPKIGPFSLEPTTANLEFLYAFVKMLIESDGYRMTQEQGAELFEAIRSLYVLEPEHRRLSTLATTVSRSLGKHLKRWTEGEQYGHWFDHSVDEVTFNRTQYFDFEEMEQLGIVLEPLMFYLFHRVSDVVNDDALGTVFKIAVVDEASFLLRNPVTLDYITAAVRTWRKKNAAMLLSTQALEDLTGSSELRPLIDNCPTKLLFSNPTLNAGFYAEVLQLNAVEVEKLRTLLPKRQFLMKRDDLSKVLTLNVDPKSYWLFTTNPHEAKRRQEVVDQVGLEAALEILAGGSR
jgi:type IV secretion/conjugal transfer VirB4 family ATPase